MGFCKVKLRSVAASDTELMDSAVSEKVVTAAHDGSVAEFHAEILIPQIRVCVKLQNMQIGIFCRCRSDGPQCNKMLAPHQNGQLAVIENLRRTFFNIGKGKLGLDTFRFLVNDPRFRGIPMILELDLGDDEFRENLATLRSLVEEPA